ncbi:MAG: flagellar hook protein FlgE, partial [bacterium]
MLGCLSSGITGLAANNLTMSVIANNIANVNTPGYKSQRATFADILNQQSGNLEIGNGVLVNDVSSIQTQGSLESSGRVTDMAIDGSGFFIVRSEAGTYYTRAGQFHFNEEGTLLNPQGYAVQGWNILEDQTLGQPSDIEISNITLPPQSTENLSMVVNLDSNAEILPGGGTGFDINDPQNTSNYSTSVSIYDSLGNPHNITFYFRKFEPAPGALPQWSWHAVSDEGGIRVEQATGIMAFDESGLITTGSTSAATFNFTNGSLPNQAVTIDFGSGTTGTTQYAADFSTASILQDGYESGSLVNISISKDGRIQGLFTNGHSIDMALIALADFNSPDGLKKMGNNLYAAARESGQPIINPPGIGGKGNIVSFALENSNVDMATEFMKMIITQRAFQANARTITVADQLLTE